MNVVVLSNLVHALTLKLYFNLNIVQQCSTKTMSSRLYRYCLANVWAMRSCLGLGRDYTMLHGSDTKNNVLQFDIFSLKVWWPLSTPNRKYLRTSTLLGLTRENPALDSLAVL